MLQIIRKAFPFFIILLNLACYGQSIEDLDNPNHKLFFSASPARVKIKKDLVLNNQKSKEGFKIQEETFYDESGKISRKINYKPAGKSTIEYIYDSNYILQKIKYSGPKGTQSSEVLVKNHKPQEMPRVRLGEFNYTYDQKGNILVKSIFQYDSSNTTYTYKKLSSTDKLLSSHSYKFNRDGLLEKEITDTYFIYYKYDLNGNEVNKTIKTRKNRLISFQEKNYNPQNFLTQTINYSYGQNRTWPYRKERIKKIMKCEYEYY